jgi:hypothetical protein
MDSKKGKIFYYHYFIIDNWDHCSIDNNIFNLISYMSRPSFGKSVPKKWQERDISGHPPLVQKGHDIR